MSVKDFLDGLGVDYRLLLSVGAGAVIGASGFLAMAKLRSGKLDRSNVHPKWANSAIKEYCYTHTNIVESPELQELRKLTAQHPRGIMESTPDVGQFLVFIMRMIKAKYVIEVGSFTGVALMRMAQELPPEGKIFSLDVKDEYMDVGLPLMEKAGVLGKIDYRIAMATETLIQLKEQGYTNQIDLCFIDADKGNYPNYYKLCIELLRPGGIIVFDNSLFAGRVVTDRTKDPCCYIHETNEKAMVDSRVTSMLLNIGDGCLILRKNDNN